MTSAAAAASAPATPLLALNGIVKEFPGVRALDGVDLEVRAGEVLGLVGENGAGKSTLIKVLGGVYGHGSYAGEILIDGVRQRFSSAAAAQRAGIAVVHQELSLVPEMTVAENLLLGIEPRRFGIVDSIAQVARARAMLAPFLAGTGAIDPETPVSRLGVGVQQIVEIARALGGLAGGRDEARIVVLDEPTAALTDGETRKLFEIIAQCKARGTAFIYISHRLEEIFTLCDRVAVLRDGKHVATTPAAATSTDEIVARMTGKELAELEVDRSSALGDTVLQIEHLDVVAAGGRAILNDISLHVRAGEVVTLAGAMGAGRTALLATLFGIMRGRVSGRIAVDGEPVTLTSPRRAMAAGLALVPEDRKDAGLVLGMSVAENLTLAALRRLSPHGLLDAIEEERVAARQADELHVKTAHMATEVGTLSGGNQQKVVIGKWLLTEPRLLLLDEPTRGVDVGAKAEIYRLVRELVRAGHAVLMASSDLPEVELLSDRVVVLREGCIAGELCASEITQKAILDLAIG